MSKKRKLRAKSAPKGRRFSIPLVVSIVVVVAAAITVVSRQVVTGNNAAKTASKSGAESAKDKYVTVKVAGQDVQVNQQTGQIKPLTPQEAKQLADGLKGMLNRSTEGLVAVTKPDGSTSMDLQGRFQNVAVARVNDDGSLTKSCVDNPQAAASFFGLDPKLLGVAAPANQSNQPAKSATVKSTRQ